MWIQAASGGEAYLAGTLLEALRPSHKIRVLVTTNTRQGMDILTRAVAHTAHRKSLSVESAYFPFDRPAIIEKAVKAVSPKVMVLLETEIWPGLLRALKIHHIRTAVINGRMTAKSLKRYRVWPAFWAALRPDAVLAISSSDARRFAALFGPHHIEVMPNIKFDRFDASNASGIDKTPLDDLLPPGRPLLVLGSTREAEEADIERMIRQINRTRPDTMIGLFPRHMHRIPRWKSSLDRMALPWVLRSQVHGRIANPTVILWDTFGELTPAYARARAAFVGGSLAPLGGQNFLEPLTHGLIPVIGPSWENFSWVGGEIVTRGLVKVAAHWRQAVHLLMEQLDQPPSRETVQHRIGRYIREHRGGTEQACRLITQWIDAPQ